MAGTINKVSVGRSYPPDQIAWKITSPTGRISRWGEDEYKHENVLGKPVVGTEIPGGFKSAGGVLARDPQREWPELQPYSEIEGYLGSGKRIFEGYLDKAPDVSGDQASISPAALGWQAAMEDDQTIRIGFINQLLSAFGDGSAQRNVDLLKNNYLPPDVEIRIGFLDTGETAAGIFFTYTQPRQAGKHPVGESWFDGGGLDIGVVYSDAVAPLPGGLGAGMINKMRLSKNDYPLSAETIDGTDADSGTQIKNEVKATGPGYKYAFAQSRYDEEGFLGTFAGDTYGRNNIVVMGYPALELQGAWPNVGLLARQMLISLFNQAGGILTTKESNIDNDGFVIPQAWYPEGMTLADIVKDLVKYGWYDWFFYKGREFELRKPGTYGRTWKASVAASNLNEVGIDSSRSWDRIMIQWNDVSGKVRNAGWVGSGCDTESSELQTKDFNNPAVAAGRPRKYLLRFSGDITEATAIELGRRFLEEAELINRSGSATLVAYVMDERGHFHPVSEVQSGEWIEFTDAHDKSKRKVVNTNLSQDKRTNEIDLDAPASGLDALLERLNAVLIPLGVGL